MSTSDAPNLHDSNNDTTSDNTPVNTAHNKAPLNPYYDDVPHKLKNADVEPVKPLSPEVMQSVKRLLEEVFSHKSKEVMLHAPNGIYSEGNEHGTPGITHHSDIDFGDVETYHEVIDRFLLNFGDNPKFVNDNSLYIENFVRFMNPEIPWIPDFPIYARVHAVTPPAVEVAVVTIVKVPRQP